MDGVKFGALICCFIGIVLLVTVLASSDWVETTGHSGLWKICNDTICNPFGMQMQGYIHATRALLIIALIMGTVSFADLCASFSHAYSSAGSWTKFTSKASFFAGLLVIAALGTFTGGYFVSREETSVGWTYGLGWIPGPLFFITGVYMLNGDAFKRPHQIGSSTEFTLVYQNDFQRRDLFGLATEAVSEAWSPHCFTLGLKQLFIFGGQHDLDEKHRSLDWESEVLE